MKRTREDNTISIIQRAVKYFGIPITNITVREELKSHPNYPSFKSICDSFVEWKVEHYPLRYKPEELKELTVPFIAHLKNGGGQLAFISKIRNGKATYYESYKIKKKIVLEEFYKLCSGAIILLNPDERSGEKNYRKKRQDELISKSVLPVALLTLLLYISLTLFNSFKTRGLLFQQITVILLLTKTLGITLSILLVLHEFHVRLTLTEKLCHLNKATNCNTVLNDKASKIFGWFGWADVGFIYFSGCLLVLLDGSGTSDYSLLAILSALSLPYPIFSIYYQRFVLKKWCTMCLGVQLILIIEFILLLPQFSNLIFSFSNLSRFVLILLVIAIIYTLAILFIREKRSNEIQYYKYMGFKKSPDIFRMLVSNQKHHNIPITESSLVFGDKDSQLMITAFLSLQCSHCANAFEKIKNMLKSEVHASFNIVLNSSDRKILNTLFHSPHLNKNDETLNLLQNWYNMDMNSRTSISENLLIPDLTIISEEVYDENHNLFKSCGVIGTPTFFVNGYLLPNQYDIDDIKYFYKAFT